MARATRRDEERLSAGVRVHEYARVMMHAKTITNNGLSIELSFPFPPAAAVELFSKNYGPTVATLKVLDPSRASQLRVALVQLFQQHNVATDGTTTIVGEYLDVQAIVACR
ncbi:MAG: hypothetical protein ABI625_13710 [bacterium]